MNLVSSFVISASLLVSIGQTSMNGDILFGTSLDPRITRCGIRIAGTKAARIAPFIETLQDNLSGTVRLSITKHSAGGTSSINQSVGFSGSSLRTEAIIDRPSHARIQMTVSDGKGVTLCRLDHKVDLVETARDI